MKIGSLWILAASMVKQSPGTPHAACSIDAIVEECAAASHECGEKDSLQDKPQSSAKACAIQQSAYPSCPGKWHVHLACGYLQRNDFASGSGQEAFDQGCFTGANLTRQQNAALAVLNSIGQQVQRFPNLRS
jgi:hypothetical protein